MVFNTTFNSIRLSQGSQCTYASFPEILLTSILLNTLLSHWLLSHVTIVDTMDSGERGMNPFAMTIINPRKTLTEPGIEPAISCSQVLYSTDGDIGLGDQWA